MTADDQEALRHLLDEWARDRDPWEVHHTVQVTSFGGSGTTALIDHLRALGLGLPESPGQWPFKHQRHPPDPAAVPRDFRVIYLLGDPRDAVVSLFRRDYQHGHFAGMHGREPGPTEAATLQNLDSFLAGATDLYDIEGHLDAWRHRAAGYPVLFIRYEALETHWVEVSRYVGLAEGAPALPFRARASSWRALAPTERAQINHIYGDLAERISAMPQVQLA